MSKPHFDVSLLMETPVMFSPTVAKVFGVNGAVFLQEIAYLTRERKGSFAFPTKEIDDKTFVQVSLKSLCTEKGRMRWATESTLQRIIKQLREAGVLLVEKGNPATFERGAWFAIDEKKLSALLETQPNNT